MNHEIDFYPDDIYIRDGSLRSSVTSLLQRPRQNFGLNAGELRLAPPCLGEQPLQMSCLSEALTLSVLIALTGSGRLFISFSFTQSYLWLIWRRLKPCSVIHAAHTGKEGHQRTLCVSYITSSESDTKCQRLNMLTFFSYMVVIRTQMQEAGTAQLVTSLVLYLAQSQEISQLSSMQHMRRYTHNHTLHAQRASLPLLKETVSWIFHDPHQGRWLLHFRSFIY